MITSARVASMRLAAQRLAPESTAADAADAARSVCGIQAQDPRAAALALRSRVPGLRREQIDETDLVRTWTVRGTLHLVAVDDLPWLHAACAPRFLSRTEAQLDKRGQFAVVRGMLDDLLDLIDQRPCDRGEILEHLTERGHDELRQPSVNLLVAWVALQGLALGTPDGRWRRSEPPASIDPEEARATMAQRYLEGYGPATARDLAAWSGLPLTVARRAIGALGPLESEGELLGLPGTFDACLSEPADCSLLAAFDTVMLGYTSREPIVAAAHDRRILPGGGMLKASVLNGAQASGTWRLAAGSGRPSIEVDWFARRRAAPAALATEADDVVRFLGAA